MSAQFTHKIFKDLHTCVRCKFKPHTIRYLFKIKCNKATKQKNYWTALFRNFTLRKRNISKNKSKRLLSVLKIEAKYFNG